MLRVSSVLSRPLASRHHATRAALGLDYGTEAVRAVLLDCATGRELGVGAHAYEHGQITEALPGTSQQLPTAFALQHPLDWLRAAEAATAQLGLGARLAAGTRVMGVGVDFTSCTVLPVRREEENGALTPLCLLPEFAQRPHAWPKLWKHHGAASQAEELSTAARAEAAEHGGWLRARYGSVIGAEWLFPKLLEVFDDDREVFDAATHFLEAGDWVVHQLLRAGGAGGPLVRSACNAGYKACWSRDDGFLLQPALLDGVRPGFGASLGKLEGEVVAPGCAAGTVAAPATAVATAAAAGSDLNIGLSLGLEVGTVCSASTIDAHAGVLGVGAGDPGTLVCVLGTSACYLVNGPVGARLAVVEGVAGAVEDGIVPGLVGYETGQAAVGDAFAWLQRFCGWEWAALEAGAAALPPGADGVACVDHFNGCRTPLMDPSRAGSLHGLRLSSTPPHVYRSLAEASAFGCRWIVQLLEEGGVDCGKLVATGGLAHQPFIMSVLANVLQREIIVHPTTQGPATGAAIYGAAAAASYSADNAQQLGFCDVRGAVDAMATAGADGMTYVRPDPSCAAVYDELFVQYLALVSAGDCK